jgi:hypothetical protein
MLLLPDDNDDEQARRKREERENAIALKIQQRIDNLVDDFNIVAATKERVQAAALWLELVHQWAIRHDRGPIADMADAAKAAIETYAKRENYEPLHEI